MCSTRDKAGRLVAPKTLRDSLVLVVGEVEVTDDKPQLLIDTSIAGPSSPQRQPNMGSRLPPVIAGPPRPTAPSTLTSN